MLLTPWNLGVQSNLMEYPHEMTSNTQRLACITSCQKGKK